MTGIQLASLPPVLTRVPAEHAAKPIRSFDALAAMGDPVRRYMEAVHESVDLEEHGHGLPLKAYARLDADQTAKLCASVGHSMDSTLREALEADPAVLLARKIRSSMWRWGFSDRDWNAVVDAYDAMRAFDLGVDGFTATLDHTTWYNERGRSRHAGIFLDGVFAFLVHWRGEHVMTLGFSVASDRRVLLQQIQTTRPTGNRWLFRLPANRTEFFIARFVAAFAGFSVHVVDGWDVATMNLKQYQEARDRLERDIAGYRGRLEAGRGDAEMLASEIERSEAKLAEMTGKVRHLARDRHRLRAVYADTGRFARGETYKTNGLRHYAIAA